MVGWRLGERSGEELEVLREEWGLFCLLPEFKDISMRGRGWYTLSAWLTNFVYETIMEKPFFFPEEFMGCVERERGVNRTGAASVDRDMGVLLRRLEACKLPLSMVRRSLSHKSIGYGEDSGDVQQLRAQLIRLLNPENSGDVPDSVKEMQKTTVLPKSYPPVTPHHSS